MVSQQQMNTSNTTITIINGIQILHQRHQYHWIIIIIHFRQQQHTITQYNNQL